MRIDVALLPQLLLPEPTRGSICIVIDVLRATTTLTSLLACGATGVTVAADPEAARAAKRIDPTAILLGEIGGLRPDDFDLGNSPREITPAAVAGRRAICSTSNGTAAIRAATAAPLALLGCLRNGTAVVRVALDAARQDGLGLTIVCSGGAGGRSFALDDTLTAGHLVAVALQEAERGGLGLELTEAALAAQALRHGAIESEDEPTSNRWERVLRQTAAGRHLAQIGLGEDIPFCADVDRETTVPQARLSAGSVYLSALSSRFAAHACHPPGGAGNA